MKMLHHKPHHVITSYTNNSYCPYSVRTVSVCPLSPEPDVPPYALRITFNIPHWCTCDVGTHYCIKSDQNDP